MTVSLPPTISVFGYKDSGKTTVTTKIIAHLVEQKFHVLSAKHVGDPEFSLDSPGTDSYRHLDAGASATFLHSESATALLLRQPITQLKELLSYGATAIPADVIVLEGFRFWTQKDPSIAKVICIRTTDEISEFQVETTGPILGQCTLNPNIESVIQIPAEFPFLLEAIDKWLLTAPTISIGDQE
ncbi:MAG: molybdopterin-guanine dinucleotide biosynthesis protein B [Promethearchaeota archaeon]